MPAPIKKNRTLNEIKTLKATDQASKEIEKQTKEQTYSYLPALKNGIKVDSLNKKIYLFSPFKNIANRLIGKKDERLINYNQILSSEIFEDGSSIIKTNRTSQVGGAIVGNLILGPVGLLIGGLSGSKKNINKVSNIDLRIVINDIKNPTHILNFLNMETDKSGFTYKTAIANARKWQDLLSVIIKDADTEDDGIIKPASTESNLPNSKADELNKIVALKANGAITEEEFEVLKKQIIDGKN
jgi:hypothetical protein